MVHLNHAKTKLTRTLSFFKEIKGLIIPGRIKDLNDNRRDRETMTGHTNIFFCWKRPSRGESVASLSRFPPFSARSPIFSASPLRIFVIWISKFPSIHTCPSILPRSALLYHHNSLIGSFWKSEVYLPPPSPVNGERYIAANRGDQTGMGNCVEFIECP
jgi:hypothetical protein